jgi:hypothetical protein
MATITGGPLTVQATDSDEYAELLANAQANEHVNILSTNETELTIVVELV